MSVPLTTTQALTDTFPLTKHFFHEICGGPLVVEGPGQLLSLPIPKSGPAYIQTWSAIFYFLITSNTDTSVVLM